MVGMEPQRYFASDNSPFCDGLVFANPADSEMVMIVSATVPGAVLRAASDNLPPEPTEREHLATLEPGEWFATPFQDLTWLEIPQ